MTPSSKSKWPRFPIITLGLAGMTVFWIRSLPEFERNLKGWLTAGIPLLVLLLNLLWLAFTKRYPLKHRMMVLTALLGLGLVLKATLRVDGAIDGTGLPKLVWKGSSAPATTLKATAPSTTDGTLDDIDPRLKLARDVPQFFGQDRTGKMQDLSLSRDWKKSTPQELWRQPIGQGWSAYAVVGARAYTMEQRGEEECVTCYHLLTGKLLWVHAEKTRFSQWQGGDGPRTTPTVSQGRVYTLGATGFLCCLDAKTGLLIWKRSILTENKLSNLEWGLAASPLLVGDLVIVTGGGTRGPALYAFHTQDGSDAWKAGSDQASYASPMLTQLNGKRVILSNNALALSAHDPSSGVVLFTHVWGDEKWPKASQPVVIGSDQIFLSAGYGMGCVMLKITTDDKGQFTASELWKNLKMKTQFNSAALLEEHLYGLDDGRLACLEVQTGERVWKDGRFASGQTLMADDLILIQNEKGSVHLAVANPQGFQELGEIAALSSKTWNHPTLAGHFLLVRNDRESVCYLLP